MAFVRFSEWWLCSRSCGKEPIFGREGERGGRGGEVGKTGPVLMLTITNLVYKREEDSRLQLEEQRFNLGSSCGHPCLILLQK